MSDKPLVIVPQLPTRWDVVQGRRIPSVNMNPASAFGEVVSVIEGSIRYDDMPEALETIKASIESMMGADDYVVCSGDPIIVAAAISYGCALHETIRVLRWDKNRQSYDELRVKL